MTSESFGCHDFSRRRLGASAGWESCCFSLSEMLPRSLWWLPSSSERTARGVGCYWTRVGGTGGRWGLRAVRTTLGQWIPTLVEQADSGPLGAGRRRTMTTGTLRRWWAGVGGGGPVTEAPGSAARTPDSLPRGPVSTALTSTSPASVRPAGIVEILRFLFGVQRRYAFNVSTMDTHTPLERALGPPACPGLPSQRVPQKA